MTICQISRTFMVFEKLDECSCLSEECMFASLPYISNIWLMLLCKKNTSQFSWNQIKYIHLKNKTNALPIITANTVELWSFCIKP